MTEERDEKAGDCFSDDRKRCAWITPKSGQIHCLSYDGDLEQFKRSGIKVGSKCLNVELIS